MRIFAEVISAEVDIRNITDRKTGEIKPTEIFVIHAVDSDFPQNMYKISVWEQFQRVERDAMKGAVLELIYRQVRPANQYEKLDQITVSEENIRVVKSAEDAIKEMQAMLAKQRPGNRKLEDAIAATS